jgi:hypothetical protein
MKIYSRMMGGAGNQLFQYAAAKKAASRLDAEVICDLSFLNYYSQPGTGITPRKFALAAFEGIQTVDAAPDNATLLGWEQVPQNRNSDVVMHGYFQDLKFLPEPDEIRSWHPVVDRWAGNEVFTSIHVRRGDYVTAPNAAAFHCALNLHYYKAAVAILEPTPLYALYSDDGEWCRENMFDILPKEKTVKRFGGDEIPTIWDMAACGAIIMANSTFSWWAAYLCGHNNVVYPSPWFRGGTPAPNIFKPEWKRIEC